MFAFLKLDEILKLAAMSAFPKLVEMLVSLKMVERFAFPNLVGTNPLIKYICSVCLKLLLVCRLLLQLLLVAQ